MNTFPASQKLLFSANIMERNLNWINSSIPGFGFPLICTTVDLRNTGQYYLIRNARQCEVSIT